MESYIPAIDESDKHMAFALYMGGWTKDEIISQVGCTHSCLSAWITREGWAKQKEAIAEARRKKNPPEKSHVVGMLANPERKAENVRIFQEKTGHMAKEDAEHWADLKPEERLIVAPAIASLNGVHRKNLELDREQAGDKGLINITFLNSPNAVRQLDDSEVVEINPSEP